MKHKVRCIVGAIFPSVTCTKQAYICSCTPYLQDVPLSLKALFESTKVWYKTTVNYRSKSCSLQGSKLRAVDFWGEKSTNDVHAVAKKPEAEKDDMVTVGPCNSHLISRSVGLLRNGRRSDWNLPSQTGLYGQTATDWTTINLSWAVHKLNPTLSHTDKGIWITCIFSFVKFKF